MIRKRKNRILEDVESMSWKDRVLSQLGEKVRLYHGTSLPELDAIIEDGVISAARGRQHGETFGINWFSLKSSDNFGTGTVFSIEVPKSKIVDGTFKLVNSGELTAKMSEIPIAQYNLRIEKIGGMNQEVFHNMWKRVNGDVFDFVILFNKINREAKTYPLSVDAYVMRYLVIQEFGIEVLKKEGIIESVKKVRQGIIPYEGGMVGESADSLNEVEASDINLKSFEVKDELNPKFWINNKLNSRVRLKLLDLADEFYDSLNIDWVEPEDIILTGSIANYNWSKYSDVDVHILIDYKKVWNKTEIVEDYFSSKKTIWSQEHEGLKIYGFPVEIYVEDSNNDNPSTGIYSLNTNKWIVDPADFEYSEINEPYIKEHSADIMTKIDEVEKKISKEKDTYKLEELSTAVKKLFDKLHKQRRESLRKNGELGTYNIIWKVLRRTGYLDKMWEIINNVYNKVNSIK